MAIVNRALDASQQKRTITVNVSTNVAASAGKTYNIFHAPWPCTLKNAWMAASGLSGAPTVAIDVLRFNGVGGTSLIPGAGATLTVLAYGASSATQGFSMAASGSSLLDLQKGDLVQLTQHFSGGNVAIGDAVVSLVVQPIQDILQHFGE